MIGRIGRIGLALGLAAVGVIAAAIYKRRGDKGEPKPPPSTGGERPALTDLAERLTTLLSENKFAEVVEHFDANMAKAMGASTLADTWVGLTAQLGSYITQLGTTEQEHDGYQILFVTTQFEAMVMDLRWVFDKDHKVAGFFIKPTTRDDAYGPRPQHPTPPFPYLEREVEFTNKEDGAVFAGTLSLPEGDGPFAAALLITGSGSQDRDETIFGHKPFLVLADALTRQGLAVLRVDDRGSGKTKGDTKAATVELHATDAEAAVVFLAKQKEIDAARIGLIGHSEGGLIAAMVAARADNNIAFIVSLAGTGLPGTQINPLQVEALLRAKAVMSDEGVDAIVADQRALMKLVASDGSAEDIDAALEKAVQTALKFSPKEIQAAGAKHMQARLKRERASLLSPWFRSFLKLDPAPHWAKVTCPVLALIGDKDRQVPAKENFAAIDEALTSSGHDSHELVTLADLNHLFQRAESGLVAEYAKIEHTFDEEALARVTSWVVDRTTPAPPSA